MDKAIHRVVDLTDPERQLILNLDVEAARRRLLDPDPAAVLGIAGSFALVARDGERVHLARSLDRPLRYFLAKETAGPLLVVAERMDEIRDFLGTEGYGGQFHPTYTRMVPAHHVTRLRLIGCPDPNPEYLRFFAPPRAVGTSDLEVAAETYVAALRDEVRSALLALPREAPLGVLFSGGLDSGTVLLAVVRTLLDLGMSPARLKAFTLAIGGDGPDARQAREFLAATGLEMLGEEVAVDAGSLDPFEAVAVIEDYKPLDVECATMVLALARGIRRRYPEWRFLFDGDGGDENLKSYPIEENSELTIRSVVNNSMLYQEGWGVGAIKHSLTYSGGFSRGCVRGHAPLSRLGFQGLSPFARPGVIAAAEAIPFAALTGGSNERLYALKAEVLARGVRRVLGFELPVFPKRRFQLGAAPEVVSRWRHEHSEASYRRHLAGLYA